MTRRPVRAALSRRSPDSNRRGARRHTGVGVFLACAAVLPACTAQPAPTQTPSAPGPSGSITVLAAASLTDSFGTLARTFESAHPGTTVTLSFASSSALATQVIQGAPVDVFASAAAKPMQQVVAAGEATAPTTFASNAMAVVVPPDNPAHVTALADLAKPGVKVALCQVAAPCGAAAADVLAKAGMTLTPVTLEADVRATLTKVELGEVDAGIVYVTDVQAAGEKVIGIAIPDELNATTSYLIAPLVLAPNPALAQAFVGYVLSPAGSAVLAADGFRQP